VVEKIYHKCECGKGCFISIPGYVRIKTIKDILSGGEEEL